MRQVNEKQKPKVETGKRDQRISRNEWRIDGCYTNREREWNEKTGNEKTCEEIPKRKDR